MLKSLMDFKRILVVILLCCLITAGGLSQQELTFTPAAEELFSQGLSRFKGGKFNDAAAIFDDLYRLKPWHQRTTAAYLMLAKSWFQLRKYQQSGLLLLEFFERFPGSSYVDDAYYTLALDHLMEGHFEDAGSQLIHCIEKSDDGTLSRRAETLFEYVADERLAAPALDRFLQQSHPDPVRDLIRMKLAEKYAAGGDGARAKQLLYSLVAAEKGGVYKDRARSLLDKLERKTGAKIALILPLMEDASSSAVKSLATELLEGVNFAMKEESSHPRSQTPVSLEVRDSKRDTASALSAMRDVVSKSDVIGIVGPVFSNLVTACAPLANSSGIPMISPTATSNGLASLGSSVFQLHPDWATHGKAMARYAINDLGLKTLAILSSDNAPESLAARSFYEEAVRLGARVVAFESFRAGASDLHEPFMKIRRAASGEEPEISFAGKTKADADTFLKAGASPALIDSLIENQGTFGVSRLFGPDGRRIADSLHFPLIVTDTIAENIDIPIASIQGIFVAIDNAEEIGVIGSQMSYFNIKAQILGNPEWYDPAQLEAHKRYVRGAVFSSDFYADPRDSSYAHFDQAFFSGTARHPTKYTVIGYDTMRMLLDQAAQGATTREKLASALSRLQKYSALHTSVTLTRGRVNSEVHILRYSDSEVKRILGISVD
jgi:ABC-type branched-subunit amino acid transport system substrate-binding protein